MDAREAIQHELAATRVPKHLWDSLCHKLVAQVFDVGKLFKLEHHVQAGSLGSRWLLRAIGDIRATDCGSVYVINHSVTYMNQQHLHQIFSDTPGLLDRMKVMLDVRDGTGSFSFEEFVRDPELLAPLMGQMTQQDCQLFESICAEPTSCSEATCRPLWDRAKALTQGGSGADDDHIQFSVGQVSENDGAARPAEDVADPSAATVSHNQVEAAIKVGPSTIPKSGDGAFTSIALAAGQELGYYQGVETRQLPSDSSYTITWHEDGEEPLYIDARKAANGNWTRYMNHCADQAASCNVKAYQEGRRVLFKTRRAIKEGEELMFDYGPLYWRSRNDNLKYNSLEEAEITWISYDNDQKALMEGFVMEQILRKVKLSEDVQYYQIDMPPDEHSAPRPTAVYYLEEEIGARVHSCQPRGEVMLCSQVCNFDSLGVAFTVLWPCIDIDADSLVEHIQRIPL